jgi:hypothetical protein
MAKSKPEIKKSLIKNGKLFHKKLITGAKVSISVVNARSPLLKSLGIKLKEADLYLVIHNVSEVTGLDKRQICPLPYQACPIRFVNALRFDMKAIAEQMGRLKLDKYTTTVLSGTQYNFGEKVRVHVPSSSGELQFGLTPLGDIELASMPSDLDLTIETIGHVKTLQALSCRRLNIRALSFTNQFPLFCQSHLETVTSQYRNTGVFKSSAIVIQCEEFENAEMGSLLGKERVTIQCKRFKNHSDISAPKITIQSQLEIINKGTMLGITTVELVTQKIHNAKLAFLGSTEGSLIIEAIEIQNHGFMGGKTLLENRVRAGTPSPRLVNGDTGILLSEAELILKLGPKAKNHGQILAKTFNIEGVDFKNSLNSKLFSETVGHFVFDKFSNDGIIGARHLTGNIYFSAPYFENGNNGIIYSRGTLTLEKGKHLLNQGELLAGLKLFCETERLVSETGSALLSGEEATIQCTTPIVTKGRMGAQNKFTLVAPALKNELSSKIGGNGTVGIKVSHINNMGDILGRQLTLTNQSLHTEQASLIYGSDTLKITTKEIAHAGTLSSQMSDYDVKLEFDIEPSGIVVAGKAMQVATNTFKNAGFVSSEETLAVEATERLTLLKAGRVDARTNLTLQSRGKIATEAHVLAGQTLTLGAKVIQHADGQLESQNGDILLTTADWMLGGKLKAARNLIATVQNTWDWQTNGDFLARGTTTLNLEQGYTFVREINAPGSLVINCYHDKTLHNQVRLFAAEDLILRGGVVLNGVVGKIFAKLQAGNKFESKGSYFDNAYGGVFGKDIVIDHLNGIRNGRAVSAVKYQVVPITAVVPWYQGNGAYLASSKTATLLSSQGNFLNEFSELDVGTTLTLQMPKGIIDNQGGIIRTGGEGTFQATYLYHRMFATEFWTMHQEEVEGFYYYTGHVEGYCYANSAKPILQIRGNGIFNCPISAYGGDIHAGLTLYLRDGITATPVEECTKKVYSVWTKGERKGIFEGHNYYWVHTPNTKRHQLYSANVSGGQYIFCNNSQARFVVGGALQTKFLDLQFSTLHVGRTLSWRQLPPPKLETKLREFLYESKLFRRGGDPNSLALLSPVEPLNFPTEPLPPCTLVAEQNATKPLLLDPRLEMRIVSVAMAERLGRISLDEEETEAALLVKLRQNALDYAHKIGTKTLTEAALLQAEKPLLIYRNADYQGQVVLEGSLIVPLHHTAPKEGVFAEQAVLEGGQLRITSTMEIQEHLKFKLDTLSLEQQTVKEYAIAFGGYKGREQTVVALTKAVDNTGILMAGTIAGEVRSVAQRGGAILTGTGGLDLKVREEMKVSALRTTALLQSAKDSSILPEFIPALIVSEGKQYVAVTAGGFIATGLISSAVGDNVIQAKEKIEFLAKNEEYRLPTEQHRRGHVKQTVGGTSSTVLGNQFISGGTASIKSQKESVILENIQLASGEGAKLEAPVVLVKEVIAKETEWSRSKTTRGMTCQKTKMYRNKKIVLPSTLLVYGDLNINAQDRIHLTSVQGLVQGDLNADAPLIEIDGAKEQTTTRTQTSSFGISFFGLEALEVLAESRSGRKALQQLLREDSFLNAADQLARSKSKADLTVNTIQTFIEGWRLATMVGYACDNNGLKGTEVFGGFTDRWGITTSKINKETGKTERIFNPRFTFQWGSFKQEENKTQTISSHLKILGEVRVTGEKIYLKDGTTLYAKNIRIAARKLLAISAAKDTYDCTGSGRGHSLGVTIREMSLPNFGVQGSKGYAESTTHSLAKLKASEAIDLNATETLQAVGVELTAGTKLSLSAKMVTYDSVQDTSQEKASQYSASVNLGAIGGSMGVGNSSSVRKQTRHSVAAASNIELTTNVLMQAGSALCATESITLKREDGTNAPVLHTVQHLMDTHNTESQQVNFGISPQDTLPVTGSGTHRNQQQQGITYATLAAPTVSGAISMQANRDPNKLKEEFYNQKRSFGMGLGLVNIEKMSAELSVMKRVPNALNPFNGRVKQKTEKEWLLENAIINKVQAALSKEDIKVSEECIRQAIAKEGDQTSADIELISTKIVSLMILQPNQQVVPTNSQAKERPAWRG